MKKRTFIGLLASAAFLAGAAEVHALKMVLTEGSDPMATTAMDSVIYAKETLLNTAGATVEDASKTKHYVLGQANYASADKKNRGEFRRQLHRHLHLERHGVHRDGADDSGVPGDNNNCHRRQDYRHRQRGSSVRIRWPCFFGGRQRRQLGGVPARFGPVSANHPHGNRSG